MSDSPSPSTALDVSRGDTALDPSERPTWVRYRRARLPGGDDVHPLPGPLVHQPGGADHQEGTGDLRDSEGRSSSDAFTLAYAVFEIPAGRWGDRYGSRRILTRIVLWWSFFTALTGAAWGFGSLRRHSIPVRGGRGGGVAELGAGLAGVVSRFVARACPGDRHDGDAARRRGLATRPRNG